MADPRQIRHKKSRLWLLRLREEVQGILNIPAP